MGQAILSPAPTARDMRRTADEQTPSSSALRASGGLLIAATRLASRLDTIYHQNLRVA